MNKASRIYRFLSYLKVFFSSLPPEEDESHAETRYRMAQKAPEEQQAVEILDNLISATRAMTSEEFAQREKALGVDTMAFDPSDYIDDNDIRDFRKATK